MVSQPHHMTRVRQLSEDLCQARLMILSKSVGLSYLRSELPVFEKKGITLVNPTIPSRITLKQAFSSDLSSLIPLS
ncbi:hypothetical protein EG68_07134 [Paragonimus skrjabini miyazakii]|uniref:Uncharacterized protein n=1 Tax=Paragonimus skrjabini miyazakii TaxID=59628 RepID=A0A8S9YFE8_9TREM|nr:hypothetical protein EG68_07134 [Paragonimus skrjabini miyazakii]